MRRRNEIILLSAIMLMACGNTKSSGGADSRKEQPVAVSFSADSAYRYCAEQCSFGPRTMNSEAHDACGEWIAAMFRSFGMEVTEQKADLKGYDGTTLHSTNIIASFRPEAERRVIVAAHWDSRPWADNDPDEANHHTPVMAANDGASGVAVLLELARLLQSEGDSLKVGVDLICFDAEDWGIPQWSTAEETSDSWALGAQYWAAHPHKAGYTATYGILLDMVGGQGAQFYQESFSKHYAATVVRRVWQAAKTAGYSGFFPKKEGGYITDDHVPVNKVLGVPMVDIVPYYPGCEASSFGPTWHTVSDDLDHIDPATLKAVGQTIVQVLFSTAN